MADERYYKELVEGANSIILRMDTDGKVTFLNPFGQRFFAFTAADIIGKNVVGTIVEPTDTAGRNLKAMITDILQSPEKYVTNENENILSDGRRAWISWTNKGILDDKGGVKEVLCIGNDISKIKQAEAEILKAKEAAESANKAKSSFLANMSHELRSPLNAVIGFADLMNDEDAGKLNEKQKEYISHIRECGTHLLSVINDILDLSKVESGKMELKLEMVDVGSIVKRSILFVSQKAALQSLTISTDIEEGIGPIKADGLKLKQILLNLLSNAVKFTPPGGKIDVIVKRSGERELAICVSDTGIGIDPKDSGKVFAEFEQIDNEYSRKYAGTGLGIALSKRFAELHGGAIYFESEGKDKGSRFYVKLPIV